MRVCVIGAGPSGLTTIKQLLDENHDVTCFDTGGEVGGIWYRHDGDADEMKAYDHLMLTVSMKLMAFSDFPFEDGRKFYSRENYFKYLQAYAHKFDLRRHIRFKTSVEKVRKLADGQWSVAVTSNGKKSEHLFDAVSVCTGPFQKPSMQLPELEKFTGEVLHSSRYRNAENFRGKRVLVVGLAESGADLLKQVSDVASECTLSIRSYSYLLPRLPAGTYSTDDATTRAHHFEMYVRSTKRAYPMKAIFGDNKGARAAFTACAAAYGLASVASKKIGRLLGPKKRKDRAARAPGLNNMGEPAHPKKMDLGLEWTQEHTDAVNEWNRRSHSHEGNWSPKIIFCKNVTFIANLVNGKIALNDAGIARIEGKRVYFKNDESKEFDAIVLCIGFEKDFSIFGEIRVPENNVRNLYKHCFHPDHDGRLAFMGITRPFSGGIPICSEMQARYFAQLCSNKLKLPADVRERIRKERDWEEYFTSLSPRATESLPSQIFYIDAMARELDCLMPLSELIRKPQLLLRHWFYPFNQACYRLTGPHAMPESALAYLMAEKPGPLSGSAHISLFSALSLLPSFIHPKDLDHVGPLGPRKHDSVAASKLGFPTAKGNARGPAPGKPMEQERRTGHPSPTEAN